MAALNPLRALSQTTQTDTRLTGDMLSGIAPSAGDAIVCYNGRPWATVPVHAGDLSFSCRLPPVAAAQQAMIEVMHFGVVFACLDNVCRVPLTNALGLRASDVLDLHNAPLFAASTLQFDGAVLTIYGAHLPPLGDPSRLEVECGPGVAFDFEYALPSPEFAAHYWYWPNAHLSAFRLRIDLPASARASNPFTFAFVYPVANGDAEEIRRRLVHIPTSLHSFVQYPGPDQLARVQTYENHNTVTFTGYNAFKTVEETLSRHGVSPSKDIRILDFGCGHGRLLRHFIQHWTGVQACGVDIDAQNIDWCRRHLAEGDFRVGPLWPEAPFEAASFDVLFAISVMTHLTAEAQAAWLREFARLLKPDGLALLTFSGPGAAAFSSVFRDPAWWERWRDMQFDDAQQDPTLAEHLSDSTYYRNTLQTERDVRERWSECFDILEVEHDIFGYQSLCILSPKII